MDWVYVVIGLLLLIALIRFRNKVVNMKENISGAKSQVRILKAKYLQVLRKGGTSQRESNASQGEAYERANWNGSRILIGGAIGAIDTDFEEVGDLVVSLASELQEAQQKLNDLVGNYNRYIIAFPRIIFTMILRYKKENYVDSENLAASTKLTGFDDEDI